VTRLALTAFCLTSPVFAADPKSIREAPVVRHAATLGVGRMMPNVTVTDIHKVQAPLASLVGEKGLAICLTSTSCPVSKKYGPTLAKLEAEFAAKGIPFLFVNPIATDAAESIRVFQTTNGLKGKYIHSAELAKTLGAASTAEVILLDAKRTIVYRGAVDDQYGLGYQLAAPKQPFFAEAVAALLAGRDIAPAATSAPGCELEGNHLPQSPAEVTYHNRISRIVQANCVECHRAGGVGPFPLETSEDLISHAGMIRKVVDKGTMPPWFASAPAKGEHTPWSNDRRLTDADKADLLAWLNGSRAVGDASDAPLSRMFPEGWTLGKPDQTFVTPRKTNVPASGQIPYVNFVFDPEIKEDRWVRAVEIRPSAPAVVHHVLVFLIAPDDGPNVDPAMDERNGFFAAYVPGNSGQWYPEGFAKRLPKGSRFRFQIHYTPNGTAVTDQLTMGLSFTEQMPRYEVKVAGVANPMMRVPPGAAHHPQRAVVPVSGDVDIIGFLPHMHLRGVAARYEITDPDGKKTIPLDVPHYDFNWQLHYKLAEPLRVKNGSTLTYTAWYDNSSANPANPDPKKLVRWGQQTTDEMLLSYVEYIVPATAEKSAGRGPLHANGFNRKEVFKDIDTNGDGKISPEEFADFAQAFPKLREPATLVVVFTRLDKNKDNAIDATEFEQFLNRK
jgi:mono/diheme cytochrome c family protein